MSAIFEFEATLATVHNMLAVVHTMAMIEHSASVIARTASAAEHMASVAGHITSAIAHIVLEVVHIVPDPVDIRMLLVAVMRIVNSSQMLLVDSTLAAVVAEEVLHFQHSNFQVVEVEAEVLEFHFQQREPQVPEY